MPIKYLLCTKHSKIIQAYFYLANLKSQPSSLPCKIVPSKIKTLHYPTRSTIKLG